MRWLGDAWFIAVKDLRWMLQGKETLVWLFVMPIAFFYFLGTVTGGMGGSVNRKETVAWSVPEDAGFLVDQVQRRLEDRNYEVVAPESAEERARYTRRLEIPPGFTESVLNGEAVTLTFRRAESGMAQDYDTIRIARAVYTTLADLLATTERGQEPSPESFAALNEMPRAMTLKVQPAGERQQIPVGFEQTVPGIMVMFALLNLLSGGAVLLVQERRQGLLRRLAATPIRRGSIVLGKWISKMSLGGIQIAFAMIAGTVLFEVSWAPNLAAVILVMFCYAALCASLALLLGTLASTEGQASAVGVLAGIVLAALGGCWWPIEVTPDWMQSLQKLLPTGWAMDALHRLVSFHHAPSTVLPHCLVMVAGGLVCGWIAARRFRFQ